jgi:hypothetical protein
MTSLASRSLLGQLPMFCATALSNRAAVKGAKAHRVTKTACTMAEWPHFPKFLLQNQGISLPQSSGGIL